MWKCATLYMDIMRNSKANLKDYQMNIIYMNTVDSIVRTKSTNDLCGLANKYKLEGTFFPPANAYFWCHLFLYYWLYNT